jgi:hypothetical protein
VTNVKVNYKFNEKIKLIIKKKANRNLKISMIVIYLEEKNMANISKIM